MGKFARAIRKEKNIRMNNNKIKNYSVIETFIVLCIVCNKLDIDLFTVLK